MIFGKTFSLCVTHSLTVSLEVENLIKLNHLINHVFHEWYILSVVLKTPCHVWGHQLFPGIIFQECSTLPFYVGQWSISSLWWSGGLCPVNFVFVCNSQAHIFCLLFHLVLSHRLTSWFLSTCLFFLQKNTVFTIVALK